MITYHVESWTETYQEMQPYWIEHWKEVGMHQDALPLNVDIQSYLELDRLGILHTVTVRNDGHIIGYHLSMIRRHLRYDVLGAFTDVYFLSPAYRKRLVGYRMFQFVETSLKAKGVRYLFTGTKLSLDMGRLFERLGWQEVERLYVKLLPEES